MGKGIIARFAVLAAVLPIGLSLLVAGCQSTKSKVMVSGPIASENGALHNGKWKRVSEDPPTYFPKVVPSDHPTKFGDGSWVHCGDAEKTRFFIPARGDQATILRWTAEAEASMTDEAQKDLDRRRKAGKRKDFSLSIGKTLTGLAVGIADAASHAAAHASRFKQSKKD